MFQKIINIKWVCVSKNKGIFLIAEEEKAVVVGKSVDTNLLMEIVWVEAAAVDVASDDLS